MKYLNLGCGTHYSKKTEWTNIDFSPTGEGVMAHNLLKGVPFESNSFDLVYHSHVLEHFSKDDGDRFITECFRVLKPGGIIRIAIPDLERIVKKYLRFLEEGLQKPDDAVIRANYEWMLIEMYDQTVRNVSSGNMGKYLFQETIINEEFVFQRIGEEGRAIRKSHLDYKAIKSVTADLEPNKIEESFIVKQKKKLRTYLLRKLSIDNDVYRIGQFRLGGEIHQWMYDRYSLANLLKSKNAQNIIVRDAFTSGILNWSNYNIDGKDGIVRKPDSLFIEAVKI
jgi:predicted SAM-dependent methyltransferase